MPKNKGLSIIIVGCGKVGTTLVEQLSREGHDITVIDRLADLHHRHSHGGEILRKMEK